MKTNFKKNLGKKLSRILSAATAALMLAVSIPQASLAAIPTDNVIAQSNEFDIKAESGVHWTQKSINASVDRVIVEFDVTASSTDYPYHIMSRDENGRDFAHLMFAPNGKVVVGINGGTPFNLSSDPTVTPPRGYNAADYAANTKYRMTMIYDINGRNVEEGHNATVDYYMDGKYLYTTDTSFFSSTGDGKSDNADGKLKNIFFGPKSGSVSGSTSLKETGQTLKIENFKAIDANAYPNLEYDTPVVDEDGVSIKFSETLACANTGDYTSGNDLSNIKIKAIDGTEVSGANASIKNDTLTVGYTGSLTPGMTYYVVLPKNFKSVDEKILVDNAIAFTVPQTTTESVDATVYSQDFESLTADVLKPNEWELTNTKTAGKIEALSDDSMHGNVWHLQTDSTATSMIRGFTAAFNDADYDHSDVIEFKADFKFKEIKRTGNMSFRDGVNGETLNFFFFDNNGKFVFVKEKGHGWSTDDSATAGNTYVISNTTCNADKWYTVKILFDKKARTFTYHLGYENNGEMSWETVGTAPVLAEPTDHIGVFDCFMLDPKTNTNGQYGDFYLDNIKIGYQNINITPANIIATSENTITYNFSADENKLNDKYVLDANVKFVEAGKPIYFRCNDNKNSNSGLLFCADADGNLSMSKSLLNWKNDAFMQDLGVKSELNKLVNIKLLVDKTRTKPVTVFINNKYVRSLALGWGSEPNNADYLIDNPGAANFIKGDGNTSPNTVDSVSTGNMTVNLPKGIVLTDSANKMYSIYTDGIPADIGSVSLNYANAFADGTDVVGATLNKKAEDGALTPVDGYSAALSTDKKSIVISKDGGVLENGTYTISVSGVTGADNFTAEFVVNDTRGFVINSFSVAKDGNEYYPSITAKNYGVSQKSITVFICEYTKDSVPQLVNVEVKPIQLNGASVTIGKADLALTTTRTDTTIKAFVWGALGENKPLANAQTYMATE